MCVLYSRKFKCFLLSFVLSPIVCLCPLYYQLGSLNVFVVVETLKKE